MLLRLNIISKSSVYIFNILLSEQESVVQGLTHSTGNRGVISSRPRVHLFLLNFSCYYHNINLLQ